MARTTQARRAPASITASMLSSGPRQWRTTARLITATRAFLAHSDQVETKGS